MKLRLTHTILSGLLVALFLTSASAEKCERLEIYDITYDLAAVEVDLVTGTWISDLEGYGSTFFFLPNGEGELIHRDFEGERFADMTWNLKEGDSAMLLSIQIGDEETHSYELSPTCDGFAARAANGTSILMYKEERSSLAQLETIEDKILGSWRNDGKTATIADGDLQWTFSSDGKFELTAEPDDYHGGYTGMWEVSKDCEYLVLHFVRKEAPQKVFATRMMKLHSIDFEDLVVSGGILARFTGSQDDGLKLHFEKAF